LETISGIPVLGVSDLPLDRFLNRLIKRAIDIVGATVGLLLSAPLIAVFGALVYRESPGPILYRQKRMGRNGRIFWMLKIRSMRMQAEQNGAQWAKENDPRRLQVGAFMRKWNIDEVPQFLNVLNGDMSLVGPRPERPELISGFKYQVPHYHARHTCLPGMTGWAQVNGWRGNTSLEERIRFDIWYIENWSIGMDVRIMILTFRRQKNAY
jgi:exopolysaccharide biosynthesis polyprenyl glycosylphosphotransferase